MKADSANKETQCHPIISQYGSLVSDHHPYYSITNAPNNHNILGNNLLASKNDLEQCNKFGRGNYVLPALDPR